MGILGFLARVFRGQAQAGQRVAALEAVPLQGPIRSLQAHCGYLSVVGESHYQGALQRLDGRQPPNDAGEQLVQAILRAEPDNPHDGNAVAVAVDGYKVGYLSRQVAPYYQPIVREVNRAGHELGFIGQLRGGGDLFYGFTAHLPGPPTLRQWALAGPHVHFLIGERPVTVTGEEAHQDALEAAWRSGPDGLRNFELRHAQAAKGAYSLEVLLGGAPVGRLTPKMSERYRPYLDAARPNVAAGVLSRHDTRGIQVDLYMPRTDRSPSPGLN